MSNGSPIIQLPTPPTPEDRQFRLKVALFWVAIIAAIVITVVAGVPGWQDYMAQEEAKYQLRAYVDVQAKGLMTLAEGAVPRVRDSIHNIGRTPAFDRGLSAQISVADYPLKQSLAKDDCNPRGGDEKERGWFAGKVSRPETVRAEPFTAEEVQAIKEGRAAVYYHGRACYRDIFNEPHRTDFCLLWKWVAGRISPGLYCEQGNHAS